MQRGGRRGSRETDRQTWPARGRAVRKKQKSMKMKIAFLPSQQADTEPTRQSWVLAWLVDRSVDHIHTFTHFTFSGEVFLFCFFATTSLHFVHSGTQGELWQRFSEKGGGAPAPDNRKRRQYFIGPVFWLWFDLLVFSCSKLAVFWQVSLSPID